MIPVIDWTRCNGSCKACVYCCPSNVFAVEDKVVIKYPEQCTGCAQCVETCPKLAIKLIES